MWEISVATCDRLYFQRTAATIPPMPHAFPESCNFPIKRWCLIPLPLNLSQGPNLLRRNRMLQKLTPSDFWVQVIKSWGCEVKWALAFEAGTFAFGVLRWHLKKWGCHAVGKLRPQGKDLCRLSRHGWWHWLKSLQTCEWRWFQPLATESPQALSFPCWVHRHWGAKSSLFLFQIPNPQNHQV